ncbi:MAG: RluA family pseudouridine synthase [Gaiellaceae bacterium]
MARTETRVPDERAGERLDRYLASLSGVGSRSAAATLLAGGAVDVDGVPRLKSFRLPAGAVVSFDVLEPEPALRGEARELAIVYEDDDLLVVDKPSGLTVHPGAGRREGTLAHALVDHGAQGGETGRPGIVHRLDRETSGLLVVARNETAYRALQRMVRRRQLEREYLALVRGRPRSLRGRIEAPIGRDREHPTRRSLDSDSPRDAVTHFELAELLPKHALLVVRLETGRTHQIRVHLAAIGLPVSGDATYGVGGDLGLARQFLHARRLAFAHPLSGERVDVSSPLPEDLERALLLARAGEG